MIHYTTVDYVRLAVFTTSLAKKNRHARAPPAFVRVARLPPSAPSTTSLLHIGHVLWPASHRSTQVLWNSWLHGKRRSVSPASASHMHTAHVGVSAESVSENTRVGMRASASSPAPDSRGAESSPLNCARICAI